MTRPEYSSFAIDNVDPPSWTIISDKSFGEFVSRWHDYVVAGGRRNIGQVISQTVKDTVANEMIAARKWLEHVTVDSRLRQISSQEFIKEIAPCMLREDLKSFRASTVFTDLPAKVDVIKFSEFFTEFSEICRAEDITDGEKVQQFIKVLKKNHGQLAQVLTSKIKESDPTISQAILHAEIYAYANRHFQTVTNVTESLKGNVVRTDHKNHKQHIVPQIPPTTSNSSSNKVAAVSQQVNSAASSKKKSNKKRKKPDDKSSN